ncbi:MAG: hypothetical protein ACKN9F_05500 [Methylomonas sp.]
MSLLDNDLKAINFQFLMLARECARHNPMEAIWKFNLNDAEVEQISGLSLDEINELAECGRAIFRIPVTHTTTGITSSIVAALKPIPLSAQA